MGFDSYTLCTLLRIKDVMLGICLNISAPDDYMFGNRSLVLSFLTS